MIQIIMRRSHTHKKKLAQEKDPTHLAPPSARVAGHRARRRAPALLQAAASAAAIRMLERRARGEEVREEIYI